MASKTDVQVLLGGKVYTLSGYESEEYLQKIALYINNKMSELNELPGYKRMGSDMQKTLLELNMADDYYKARKRIGELETDLEDKDKAEYDLKHELIAAVRRAGRGARAGRQGQHRARQGHRGHGGAEEGNPELRQAAYRAV